MYSSFGAWRICSRLAEFDHLAAPEHHDAIGDLRDDREVVGDIQRGGAVLADQFAERRQAFDLRRHVQRGRRLVEHDDIGPRDHRHRRHRALQLPAGDLVRIAIADGHRIGQIELLEQAYRLGARLGRLQHPMPDRGLADLVHQRHRRIEGSRGALGDVGDARPPELTALVRAHLANVLAVQHDLAADDETVAASVAHRGQSDRGLAGAGFADQADHLAAFEHQRNVVDQHGAVAPICAHLNSHGPDVEDDRVFHRYVHAPSP